MIIQLITTKEINTKTGVEEDIISHGVDAETGRNIALPNVSLTAIGAKYHNDYGWILDDEC
ncbi:hypothetical protein phiOC_p142 [Ochrobactrum phage vB_OspM_OC]|nr:hypothetical protein phiOC_p142 [Ochrobactrum phage vB_OspM_OC]